MRSVVVAIGLFALSLGCKGRSEAPFAPGDSLTYAVTHVVGDERISYDVTATFRGSPGALTLEFKLDPPEALSAGVKGQTFGDKKLIKFPHSGGELSIGQLYLPTGDRKNGVVTPSGRIEGKRRHGPHEAWAIGGAAGYQVGTRFYEVDSGVLVGWNFEGVTAVLKGSIPRTRS